MPHIHPKKTTPHLLLLQGKTGRAAQGCLRGSCHTPAVHSSCAAGSRHQARGQHSEPLYGWQLLLQHRKETKCRKPESSMLFSPGNVLLLQYQSFATQPAPGLCPLHGTPLHPSALTPAVRCKTLLPKGEEGGVADWHCLCTAPADFQTYCKL